MVYVRQPSSFPDDGQVVPASPEVLHLHAAPRRVRVKIYGDQPQLNCVDTSYVIIDAYKKPQGRIDRTAQNHSGAESNFCNRQRLTLINTPTRCRVRPNKYIYPPGCLRNFLAAVVSPAHRRCPRRKLSISQRPRVNVLQSREK